MLTIRLQRTGRSSHAQFRVIVQDSRFSPTRGRVVAYLGSYDPHTKVAVVDGSKASSYLEKGAQPSDRVARMLQKQGIKLPNWVKLDQPQKRATRNPAKRRSTRPDEPKAPEPETPVVEETPSGEPQAETPAEEPAEETPAAEEPAAEPPQETPAAEEPAEPETPSEAEPEVAAEEAKE